MGHLLDELVVGVPLVRLWSYSETKIPIWDHRIELNWLNANKATTRLKEQARSLQWKKAKQGILRTTGGWKTTTRDLWLENSRHNKLVLEQKMLTYVKST